MAFTEAQWQEVVDRVPNMFGFSGCDHAQLQTALDQLPPEDQTLIIDLLNNGTYLRCEAIVKAMGLAEKCAQFKNIQTALTRLNDRFHAVMKEQFPY